MAQRPMLTAGPVPALIREIAIPASVGFFFNTLFNAVDTWWGGQISTHALAALSLSFPVFFIIIAVGRAYLQISAFLLYAYVVLSASMHKGILR